MKDTDILIVQTTCTHTINPLVTQKSTQNVLHHENAWAVVHVLGPSNIMLLTHICFPTRLRSTASPILSHFHTLLRLRLTAPITASGFNSCHFSTNSLSLQKFFKNIQFILLQAPYVIWVSIPTTTLWSAQEWPENQSAVLQGPFTVQKKLFYEGVCSFQCVHYDPGCYSGTGDWINEIGCLHHEARVPED